MVDNFKLIRDYLQFKSDDDFYFLQIIQRKKDGPGPNGIKVTGTNNKSRAIKTYCISSVEYLDKIEGEVKHLCDYFNARAMIILSRRSYKETALLEMVQISNMIMSGQYINVKSSYNSSCAKSKSLDKYFLIDTKHGYHLITTPFDIQGLLKVYPNKNKHEFIHKDGSTILYVP